MSCRVASCALELPGALFVPLCGVLSLLICGSLQNLRCLRASAATYQVFLQVLRLRCVLRSSICLPAVVLKLARLDVVCAIDAIALSAGVVSRLCRLFLLRHACAGSSCCATLLQALPAAPRLCRLSLLRHAFAGSSCCSHQTA